MDKGIEGLLREWGGRIEPSRVAPVITVLALSLCLYSLVQLGWRLLPQPPLPSHGGISTPVQPRPGPTPTETRVGQAALKLFGTAAPAPRVATETPTEAPTTALNLKLIGVLATSDQRAARAIITAGNAEEKLYAIGSEIAGQAVLVAIQPDQVILERNGRRESLRLIKDRLAGQTARASSPTPAPPSGEATLGDYRQKLLNNPGAVAEIIRPTPHFEKGKLIGFRLNPIRDRDLLRRNGLSRRDVITAVNGVALDNPIKGLEVMKNLGSAEQIELTVQRNGQERNVTLRFE